MKHCLFFLNGNMMEPDPVTSMETVKVCRLRRTWIRKLNPFNLVLMTTVNHPLYGTVTVRLHCGFAVLIPKGLEERAKTVSVQTSMHCVRRPSGNTVLMVYVHTGVEQHLILMAESLKGEVWTEVYPSLIEDVALSLIPRLYELSDDDEDTDSNVDSEANGIDALM